MALVTVGKDLTEAENLTGTEREMTEKNRGRERGSNVNSEKRGRHAMIDLEKETEKEKEGSETRLKREKEKEQGKKRNLKKDTEGAVAEIGRHTVGRTGSPDILRIIRRRLERLNLILPLTEKMFHCK